jgi:uncharacterized protein
MSNSSLDPHESPPAPVPLESPAAAVLAARFDRYAFRDRKFAFLPEALMPVEISDGVDLILASLAEGRPCARPCAQQDVDDTAAILGIAAAVPPERPVPVVSLPEKTYSVNPHSSCNLDCRYCFRTTEPVKPRPFPQTIAFIDKAVDFILADSAALPKVNVQFSMLGEPLLDFGAFQHLSRRVAEARERTGRQFWLTMLTNGILLDRTTVDWLHANGAVIGFSIDGPEELNDAQRPDARGRGTYARIRENAGYTLSKDWGRFLPGATATLTARNTEVDVIYRHLHDIGFRVICFNLVRASADDPLALAGAALDRLKAAFERLAGMIIDEARRGSMECLETLFYSGNVFVNPLFRLLAQVDTTVRCGMVTGTMVVIAPDGGIHMCESMTDGAFRIGDLDHGYTIPAIDWKDRPLSERQPCSRCAIRYVCGGPCAHASFLRHGVYDWVVEDECDLRRFLVRLASYLIAELIDVWPESIGRLRELITIRNSLELPMPSH